MPRRQPIRGTRHYSWVRNKERCRFCSSLILYPSFPCFSSHPLSSLNFSLPSSPFSWLLFFFSPLFASFIPSLSSFHSKHEGYYFTGTREHKCFFDHDSPFFSLYFRTWQNENWEMQETVSRLVSSPGFSADMETYSRLRCTCFTGECDPGTETKDRDVKQEGGRVNYKDVLPSWVQILCLIPCVWGPST